MSVFTLFLGIAMGATLYHCGLWLKKRHPRATTATGPQKDWEFYGHPKRPVPTLRERLPQPPSGHVWEIAVRYNESGKALLHLTLVNVAAADDGVWQPPGGVRPGTRAFDPDYDDVEGAGWVISDEFWGATGRCAATCVCQCTYCRAGNCHMCASNSFHAYACRIEGYGDQ